MEPSINYYAKTHIPVQHGSMVNGPNTGPESGIDSR
jgi:hypothetical protein